MLTTFEVLSSFVVGLLALLIGLMLSNLIGVVHYLSKSMIVCFMGYAPIGMIVEYFLDMRVFVLWGGARKENLTIEGLLVMVVSMFLFGLFLPAIGDLVYQWYRGKESQTREGD